MFFIVDLIILICLPITVYNRFRNAGLKGALKYNLGIIFTVLLGHIIATVFYFVAIDSYTYLLFAALGIALGSYTIAGVILFAANKKVQKSMPLFHPPSYIPPQGFPMPQGYNGQPQPYYGQQPAQSQPYYGQQPAQSQSYYGGQMPPQAPILQPPFPGTINSNVPGQPPAPEAPAAAPLATSTQQAKTEPSPPANEN